MWRRAASRRKAGCVWLPAKSTITSRGGYPPKSGRSPRKSGMLGALANECREGQSRNFGRGKRRVGHQLGDERQRFLSFRFFEAFMEDRVREQSFMAEGWPRTVPDSPPVVGDGDSVFFGCLFPGHYEVVAGLAQISAPLHCLFVEKFPELLSRGILQGEEACTKPTRISVGRVVEVVVSFFVSFDPLVRNQKAELIFEDENAI